MKFKKMLVTVLAGTMALGALAGSGQLASSRAQAYTPGWHVYEDNMAYAGQDGQWVRDQWLMIDGDWYWFTEAGISKIGWFEEGTKKYYLDPEPDKKGPMVTGWKTIDGYTYYFGKNGVMATGWRNIGGNWYYFDWDGHMVKGGQKFIEGDNYWFDDNGVMQTGWVEKTSLSDSEKTVWMYFYRDGAMAINCTLNFVDGKTVRIGQWGEYWEYHNAKSSTMSVAETTFEDAPMTASDLGLDIADEAEPAAETYVANGWKDLGNGDWEYYQNGKKLVNEWVKVDGYWYWLDDKGLMYRGIIDIDGVTYGFSKWGFLKGNGFVTVGTSRYFCNADGVVQFEEDNSERLNSYGEGLQDWQIAYLDMLQKIRTNGGGSMKFQLIDLDGDAYPEIFASGTNGCTFGNMQRGFLMSSYNASKNLASMEYFDNSWVCANDTTSTTTNTKVKYIPGSGMFMRYYTDFHKAPNTGWHRQYHWYLYTSSGSSKPTLTKHYYYYNGDDRPGHRNIYFKINGKNYASSWSKSKDETWSVIKSDCGWNESKAVELPYGQGVSLDDMMTKIKNYYK